MSLITTVWRVFAKREEEIVQVESDNEKTVIFQIKAKEPKCDIYI